MSLYFQCKKTHQVCFLFSPSAHTFDIFSKFHFMAFFSFLGICFEFGLAILLPHWTSKCANKWYWTKIYDSNPLWPKQEMIHDLMCRKFIFSIHWYAILFTCTTIPISLDRTFLKIYLKSTLSPFSLVPTSLTFSTISFVTNLSLFITDQTHKNP
jgi:hypothetical protein